MRFPNKLYRLNESVIFDMAQILEKVTGPINIIDLYNDTKNKVYGLDRFIDALDCLYILNKIKYVEKEGIVDVNRD